MVILNSIYVCMVGGDCLLGRKVVRFCPNLRRRVVCDGLCTVVFSAVVGSEAVHICRVREEALDLALNGG